jgi:hypothetical protein
LNSAAIQSILLDDLPGHQAISSCAGFVRHSKPIPIAARAAQNFNQQ